MGDKEESNSSVINKFEEPFEDVINYFSDRVSPKSSKTVIRGSLAKKLVGFAVLAKRMFNQSYQFAVVFFLIIGLRTQIRTFINALFGWNITNMTAILFSIFSVLVLGFFGYLLFIRWGSQKSTFELNQKQNPAQFMDKKAYEVIIKLEKKIIDILENDRERIEELEERVEKLEEKPD